MPAVDGRYATQVFRATTALYEGVGARAAAIFEATTEGGGGVLIGQNFEHTLICVKNGARWDVYQTAVVTILDTDTGGQNAFQVAQGPPINLGSFND